MYVWVQCRVYQDLSLKFGREEENSELKQYYKGKYERKRMYGIVEELFTKALQIIRSCKQTAPSTVTRSFAFILFLSRLFYFAIFYLPTIFEQSFLIYSV